MHFDVNETYKKINEQFDDQGVSQFDDNRTQLENDIKKSKNKNLKEHENNKKGEFKKGE